MTNKTLFVIGLTALSVLVLFWFLVLFYQTAR